MSVILSAQEMHVFRALVLAEIAAGGAVSSFRVAAQTPFPCPYGLTMEDVEAALSWLEEAKLIERVQDGTRSLWRSLP